MMKGELILKKSLLGLMVIGVIGIMVLILFHNKAVADQKANSVRQMQSFPVSTLTLRRQNLRNTFSKTGSIVANNEVSIISRSSGRVIAVYAGVGSYVQAGAPIIKIEDDVLGSKLAAERTAYENASREWERAQKLHGDKIISDSDLETYQEKLLTAKTNYTLANDDYNNSLITAPFAGVIAERVVNLGATVSAGTQVATMVDNSAFKIVVNVGEQEAFSLSPGNVVSITTDVYPGEELSGYIKAISAKSDVIHTFPVEIMIQKNKKHQLKSGIFGKVIFNCGKATDVLAIPREALIGSVKSPKVYVVVNGRAILHDIVVDREIGSYLVVKEGLIESDQLVVNGQENLQSNVAVKVINRL